MDFWHSMTTSYPLPYPLHISIVKLYILILSNCNFLDNGDDDEYWRTFLARPFNRRRYEFLHQF